MSWTLLSTRLMSKSNCKILLLFIGQWVKTICRTNTCSNRSLYIKISYYSNSLRVPHSACHAKAFECRAISFQTYNVATTLLTGKKRHLGIIIIWSYFGCISRWSVVPIRPESHGLGLTWITPPNVWLIYAAPVTSSPWGNTVYQWIHLRSWNGVLGKDTAGCRWHLLWHRSLVQTYWLTQKNIVLFWFLLLLCFLQPRLTKSCVARLLWLKNEAKADEPDSFLKWPLKSGSKSKSIPTDSSVFTAWYRKMSVRPDLTMFGTLTGPLDCLELAVNTNPLLFKKFVYRFCLSEILVFS